MSAAGIRPDWIAVHRALAPLALELGNAYQAHASYRALHLKHPRNVDVLENLVRCAKALGDEKQANEYLKRLEALAPDQPTKHTE